MRSNPAARPAPAAVTPQERLIRRTSRGLAFTTLALIAALLAAVGFFTAAVAIRMTDDNVDRTLEQSSTARLATLEEISWPPEESDNSAGTGEDASDEPTPLPAPTATARTTPGLGVLDPDEAQLESFQNFYLVLDENAAVLANPQGIKLSGLPDAEAAAVATSRGDDLRSVIVGGVHVRLLTEQVVDTSGHIVAILQTGYVLTQHDQQTNTILVTTLLVSLIGLLGAAVVTLLVTSRAMRPIRAAFSAERRFVASASHELRTPIAVVRASAEVLQREALVKADGERLVADIVAESDRLGRLVGDLLALASAEAGAIEIKPEPIEMRAFVAQLARRAEAIGTQRDVRIEVLQEGTATSDRELIVSADPDRVTQLLLIFIDNAIDHSPVGGTIQLFVGPASDGGRPHVSIGVADQGPGVPVNERLRIFEPFARLAGRRRDTGNAGLGLAIARVLAVRQNATLHVADAVGGGALFSVLLPRCNNAAP